MEQVRYEPPMLVEVGDFNELTRIRTYGSWIDSPWGAWS